MKVTFIYPKKNSKELSSAVILRIPPMGLIQLASLTPNDWQIETIDENEKVIDFDQPTNLVALTAMTSSVSRAYEIADEYRRRGTPTIIGGIHASMMPNEALQYVDSVVVGEADEIWPYILNEYRQTRRLKRLYRPPLPNNLDFPTKNKCDISKTQKIHFLKALPYLYQNCIYIQAGRGCPVACGFCSVTKFNGKKFRYRSIESIINEIEKERNERKIKWIAFVDDNIMANKLYAHKLFEELKRLKLKWVGQADVRIADDDTISLAVESGLTGVFLGLESIDSKRLKESGCHIKSHLNKRYSKVLRRLHDAGVVIEASFIFGFDNDNSEVFERTVEWAIDNGIDIAQFPILTPLPGTSLFAKMRREKRIITYDWRKYNATECVFKPMGLTREELEEKTRWAYKKFYSFSSITKRLINMINNHTLSCIAGSMLTNIKFYKDQIH